MVYRVRHLVNNEIQSSDDATYTLDLPTRGNLHALLIEAKCTNGATHAQGVSILDVVDRIRVVGDGDERFFELIPEEIEKWYETLAGLPLPMEQREDADAVQRGVFPIWFGREAVDREYFLPLSRVHNPRLEIEYSPNIAATAGFATGTTTFNVLAIWSPDSEQLNYRGTIITRTIANFTSGASGDEVTDIDILDPIRAVGIYAYEAGVEDGTDITRVRLEANSGEYDIWQGDWIDLLDYCRFRFGSRIVHNIHAFRSDTDTVLTRLGDIVNYTVEEFEDVGISGDTFILDRVDTITGDQLTLNSSEADITAASEDLTAYTTDHDIMISAEGNSPSYFGLVDFMSPDDDRGYLDPRTLDKLRLVLTQGGAGATVRNSLQYVKRVA